jgi:hypothetical protein
LLLYRWLLGLVPSITGPLLVLQLLLLERVPILVA